MVAQLLPPERPLPRGGNTWTWSRRVGRPWRWTRVYHVGAHSPTGHSARSFGPSARFDPQRRDSTGRRQVDPDGRSVVYVGNDLPTGLCEVFGGPREALVCPRWRAAILEPLALTVVFDLCRPGSAMAIGALPALGDGNEDRDLTQQWARAIYEDQPARRPVSGIRYRSGYFGGLSLALWDSDGRVRTVQRQGRSADHALDSPELWGRVTVELAKRRIEVRRIDSVDCHECLKDPSH